MIKDMKIELISQEEYDTIKSIWKDSPALTFQNKGYEYIDMDKLSSQDKDGHDRVSIILKQHIIGFRKFNNFQVTPTGKIRLRIQYDYGVDDNSTSFTGVGYLLLDELLNGFKQYDHENNK